MGWKIVRDNHKTVLSSHISGQWRKSPDPISALIKKLGEEYSELVENRDPEELYDIGDVLSELIDLMDRDDTAGKRQRTKAAVLGKFYTHLEWHPNPSLEFAQLQEGKP